MKKSFCFFIVLISAYINHLRAQDTIVPVPVKPKSNIKEAPDPKTLTWQKNLSLADKFFEIGSTYNAVKYYEEALNQNPEKTFINIRLADGYYALRDYKSANKYYKVLVDMDRQKKEDLSSWYYYALTEKLIGNYAKAKQSFEQFNQLIKGNKQWDDLKKKADLEILGCDLGMKMLADKSFKEIRLSHLDTNINQPFTDYSPTLKDPNTLYFGAWTSDQLVLVGKREKHAIFSRIFVSKKTGDKWGKAELAKGEPNYVNYHVGNSVFSGDGRTMYYTQCEEDEKLQMQCNIFKSVAGDTGWSAGVKLGPNINQVGCTNTEPALGKNENGDEVLYFASDRNKTHGLDIFYSKINGDGSFDKAVDMGKVINTDGDERTPHYDYQTNYFYFSSDGHVSIGGLDIFRTKFENGQWTEPENMGMPINSSVDDMYYSWSEKDKTGFVVSNRPGGYSVISETNADDIYQLFPAKMNLAVRGTVVSSENYQLVANQRVTLFDATTGDVIKTYYADGGAFFFELERDKNYKVSAVREDYFTATQTFNTLGKLHGDTSNVILVLKKMEKNKAYTLNNIYYEFDKANLTPASKFVLDTLFEILKENPTIVIELSSHTDGKGSDKYNNDLSQKRAESCVNYLVNEKHVPKERIVAKGYGKTVPVAPNTKPDGSDDPEGRAKNRRTEFKIIGEVKK